MVHERVIVKDLSLVLIATCASGRGGGETLWCGVPQTGGSLVASSGLPSGKVTSVAGARVTLIFEFVGGGRMNPRLCAWWENPA